MATKRIRIEIYPNLLCHKFHATAQLSAEKYQGGPLGGDRHNPFHTFSFGEREQELSDDTKAVIMRFYDIDGIQAVGVDANSVTIERSPAYDWSDIESEIINAIKEIADWQDNEDEIIVEYLFQQHVSSEPVPDEAVLAEAERQRREYERESERWGF